MSELRRDEVRGTWVIVAAERAGRPHDFRPGRGEVAAHGCPFCEGNEARTTPEVAALRPGGGAADGPGWTVRAVTNLYPAVRPDGPPPAATAPGFEAEVGFGHHEVLIETPEHDRHPAELTAAHVADVLEVLRGRVDALRRDDRVEHVIAFKNHGFASGASLRHPHQQLVALPSRIPIRSRQLEREREHHARTGRFRLDDQVAAERAAGTRMVAEHGPFVAFVPFAARFSGELLIAAVEPTGPFHELDSRRRTALAEILQSCLRRVRAAFGDPDFNWILHAYDREREALGAPWRFEIVPRLALLGGFELSTGATITSLPPEDAAARLRAARG